MQPGHEASPPPCPDCRTAMGLARTIPALGVLPALLTFVCERCEVAVTCEPATSEDVFVTVLAVHLR